MNSQTLKENGFAEFLPLKELSVQSIPNINSGCVFVLVDKTLSGKAKSDIMYIGRAKNPVKKIFGGYMANYGGKTIKKIHSALFNDGYIEKISISWMANDDLKAAQKELLDKFKSEHGVYPSWNISKKQNAKPKPKPKAAKTRRVRKPASPPKGALKKPKPQ